MGVAVGLFVVSYITLFALATRDVYWAKFAARGRVMRVPVDVVLVKHSAPPGPPDFSLVPWEESDVRARMEEVIDYWKRKDIEIEYRSIKTTINDDWGIMEADKYGHGELMKVVDELYVDRPVFIFVPTIDVEGDSGVAGVSAGGERRGWAIPRFASSKVAAHETGHIFGLLHYPIDSDNLMYYDGGRGLYPPLTQSQIGKVKVTIASNGWGY
ncbi:MAG: hypothetical protein GX575_31910 [Candidatus Anammoximicrobium sp.]|nr:hypothetical protein [Candidatus Anammoximicrobium sp.]